MVTSEPVMPLWKRLVLNGYEINAPRDEQEQIIFQVAAGKLGREDFANWLRTHVVEKRD
jgi:death-on-curing protein